MKINGVITTSISKIDGTSLLSISKIAGVSLPIAGTTYLEATGGTITQSGDYKVHTFLSSDNFVVNSLSITSAYNLLKINVVAGGAGGAGQYIGGGGGAGGFIENTSYSLSRGATTYPIVIGTGGAGSYYYANNGGMGTDTTFDTQIAYGGGGGGGHGISPLSGGSGGGGAGVPAGGGISITGASGIAGQGNNGGDGTGELGVGNYGAGGGGGANTVGGNGAINRGNVYGGDGGAGSLSSITGNYYAGGGGGSTYTGGSAGSGGNGGGGAGATGGSGTNGVDGTINTGGGGGGYGEAGSGYLHGGNGGSGITIISYYSPPPYLPSAQLYFDQVVTNGGSLTDNEKTYINTFITALGTDFIEFDRLWIFGLSNSVAARTSLANPTSTMITSVNNVSFTANQGYQGNGATNYLNSNYNTKTQSVKFTVNSGSIGLYSLTNSAIAAIDMGNYNGQFTNIRARQPNDISFNHVNNSTGTVVLYSNTDSRGFYVALRPNASTNSAYKNGILKLSGSIASSALNNNNIAILARTINASVDSYSQRQLSMSFIGSGIINQLNLYNAVQALGTSIGWAV